MRQELLHGGIHQIAHRFALPEFRRVIMVHKLFAESLDVVLFRNDIFPHHFHQRFIPPMRNAEPFGDERTFFF